MRFLTPIEKAAIRLLRASQVYVNGQDKTPTPEYMALLASMRGVIEAIPLNEIIEEGVKL